MHQNNLSDKHLVQLKTFIGIERQLATEVVLAEEKEGEKLLMTLPEVKGQVEILI